MKEKREGNRIKFRMSYLNQRCETVYAEGSGVVCDGFKRGYNVMLTRDCVTYRAGDVIRVYFDEVIG